jgi:CTP:molybdopterin cytidylyltransferase MocA
MPFVTREHLEALIAAAYPATTTHAGVRTPPAIFPSAMFGNLMSLTGDRGAKPLLETATSVEADATLVRDIDTPSDLG